MVEQFKRHTAYKVWINTIHTAENQKTEAGLPQLVVGDTAVVRVNVIGAVIDQVSLQGYASLLLDDGTGTIRLKVWGDDLDLLAEKKVGDLVLVVGRVGEFQDERYVRPEIVRKTEMDWALLRRVELTKKYGVPSKEAKVKAKEPDEPTAEVEPSLTTRETIMNTLEKMEEASEEDLVKATALPLDKMMLALTDLLKEGEVFSPKKGFYRLV